jgi:hypothetical protein
MMFSRKNSVFLSYSREDEHWLIELEKHLEPLRLSHLIESWHDGHISPGEEWDLQIKNQIDRAEIILLLISVDFINSRYCNEVQLVKAVERHLSGKARVIPIILRHCTWEIVPVGNLQLGQLQALPKDRKPISTFTNPDEAFSNIAKELLEVIHQNNSEHILRANSAIDESTISPTINEKEGILSEIKKIAKSFKSRENTITSHKLEETHQADEDQNQIGLDEEVIQSMHKLLMLDDAKLYFIQEPFLTDFISTYWDKIALAYPITGRDFGEASYFEVINMGYTVDWLFAIVPDPKHPLDVDWIFLRPRQAHPWHYGNHPATDNFNGGGSTSCFCEMLSIIELLAKDERIFSYCSYIKGFYDGNPPKTFENFYRNDLFRNAQNLGESDLPNIENRDNRERQMHKEICLGLYGCNAATLEMEWEVESLISGKEEFTTLLNWQTRLP